MEFANAPINKYHCNLMNAIGVKADASGFPTERATQEVTRYNRRASDVFEPSAPETKDRRVEPRS